MYLAYVFSIIALFCLFYGLIMARKVWLESKDYPVDFKRLLLVVLVLVFSAGGFYRALIELSVCTCGG